MVNSLKNSNDPNSKAEIKKLKDEISTLNKDKKKIEGELATLKQDRKERKAVFSNVKEYLFADGKNPKDLGNLAATEICRVYVNYMQRVAAGIETMGFADYYINKIITGDIALGVNPTNPVLDQNKRKGSNGGSVNSGSGAQSLTRNTLLENIRQNNSDSVQVWYDTRNKGTGTHYFLAEIVWIDKDRGEFQLISKDHAGSIKQGERIDNTGNIYGIYINQ